MMRQKVYQYNFFAVSEKFQSSILLTYLGILCSHNRIITIRLAQAYTVF